MLVFGALSLCSHLGISSIIVLCLSTQPFESSTLTGGPREPDPANVCLAGKVHF